MRTEPYVCVTEGEFDAIAAHQAGLPAVGFPGVSSIKEPYYLRPFKGYEAVYILADNDDKGQGETFAEKVAENVQNARIILMPKGHDVNSFLKADGPEALRERIGIK
jgi:DNA primase